jgi:hypothetical protein
LSQNFDSKDSQKRVKTFEGEFLALEIQILMLLQLFIINRSGNIFLHEYMGIKITNHKLGGLIFNKNLSSQAPNLSTNECLRYGSTFHGLHAITSQIAPILCQGIDSISTDTFILQCFQTLTGIKFVITALIGTADLDLFLRNVYELYSDFVLKNPFYEMEMPIRCDLFNKSLDKIVQRTNLLYTRKKN